MSIKTALTRELDRATREAAPFAIQLEHEGKRIACRLLEINSLACAFEQLSVTDPALADAKIERLKGISQQLASRLNYLLEPIRPIEVDAQQCTVQLRSNPPQREADRTSYYELIVKKPGCITLMRYSKEPGEVRQAIAAQVTREVFCRLVDDLCQASAT